MRGKMMNINNEIKVKKNLFIEEELVTIYDKNLPYLYIDFEKNKLYASNAGRLYYLGMKQNDKVELERRYLLAYGEMPDGKLYDGDMVEYTEVYENAEEKFYLLVPDIDIKEEYMLIKTIEDEVVIIEKKY